MFKGFFFQLANRSTMSNFSSLTDIQKSNWGKLPKDCLASKLKSKQRTVTMNLEEDIVCLFHIIPPLKHKHEIGKMIYD